MTPDESAWVRHVEVLQALRAIAGDLPKAVEVLDSALEVTEDEARTALTAALTALQGPAPSETAKDERIRELTDALEHMQWCRSCAEGSWTACEEGRKADRLLHSHQPWCRTEHEGACIPESIDEVAAASEDEP